MFNTNPPPDASPGSVLRPALPALVTAATAAALGGVGQLVGIWCVVRTLTTSDWRWVAAAAISWGLSAALVAFSSWLAHVAEAGFESRLRRGVVQHMLRMPADRLSAYPADRLRRLAAEDVASLHHMIAHLPSEIATLLVVPAVAVIALLALAGPWALIAFIPGALAAIAYLVLIPRISAKHGSERARVMGEITAAVDDYARGIAVLRLNSGETGAMADYQAATTRFTTGMVAWVRRVATPAAIAVGLLQAAASLSIAYAVGVSGDFAALAAILLLGLSLVTPALRLGHGLDYVSTGRTALRRISELLAEPTLPEGGNAPLTSPADLYLHSASIRLDDRLVVSDLSLTARAGEITAITGPSGAGKTTILRAIAGLQPLAGGSISVGDVPVATLAPEGRTNTVLLIPQVADALDATVADNLRLGADLGVAQMTLALDRAGLPLDLETDAALLSGGQRQRLGIARAFASGAPVLLLDEPTSALDRWNADRLWEQLADLARSEHRTVIVVTHDAALAARADRRVVVEPVTNHEEELIR